MALSSGHASNGTYRYTTNLTPNQTYSYYFYFEYGNGQTARLPESGTMSYPTIMSRDFIPMINR
jgi:hypothetical protein